MTFIHLATSKGESNEAILLNPWFIAFFSTLIAGALIIAVVALLYVYFVNPTSNFLRHQKLNKRIVSLDYKAKTIYIVDTRDSVNTRKEEYSTFLQSYSAMDARKLDTFFQEVLDGSTAVKSFQFLDVFFTSEGKRKPHKDLIVVDFVDREKKIIHFTSTVLANITKYERNEKKGNPRYRGYLTYDQYLYGFRGILTRADQAIFYLVMFIPTRDNGKTKATLEPALYELMDNMCRLIRKNRYIVKIDSSSFLLVDLNRMEPEDVEKLGEKMLYDANSFLTVKSLKDSIHVTIGVSSRGKNEEIKPLKKYAEEAKNAALAAYSSPSNAPNINIADRSFMDNSLKKYREAIDRTLNNKTWQISFLPFINMKNSISSDLYLVHIATYGEKNLSFDDFLLDTLAQGNFEEAMGKIQLDIKKRIVSSGIKGAGIVLQVPYQLFHVATKYFCEHRDYSYDLFLGLGHNSGTSYFDSDGVKEDLEALKNKKIKPLLFFSKPQLPLLPTELLEQFEGYVLLIGSLKKNSEVNEARIRIYSMLNYLGPIGKAIFVYGVDSLEELELISGRNVSEVTCSELQNWSSRLETMSEEERNEFNKYILPYPQGQ